MKNKTLKIVILVLVTIIAVILLTSSISYYSSIIGHPLDDRDATYYDESNDKKLIRRVVFNGESASVRYRQTSNRLPTKNGKVTSKYNAIDIYYDSNNNEYSFYYNTNELCGVFKNNSRSGTNRITEDEAVEIAKNYVKDCLEIDDYEIELSGLSGTSYQIKLTRKICDIYTSDSSTIILNTDGSLVGFSLFDTNRYDKDKINKNMISIAENLLLMEIKLYGGNDVNIFQKRIVSNENGSVLLELTTNRGNRFTAPIIFA